MNQNIKTIIDNLADGYKRLVKGTFQEASQVQNQRRKNTNLRNRWIYTANLPLFRKRKSSLEYGLGGRQAFDAVAGEDIVEFTRQILEKGAYTLSENQKEQLEALALDIAWQKADDLGLVKEDDEWSYFLINTSDINGSKLKNAQKPFAVKVHGSMKTKYDSKQKLPDYAENMIMLRKEGKIEQTRIYLPTQAHIERYIPENGVVARASRLYFFGISDFGADYGVVDGHFALRGVPIKVAKGDVKKSVEEQHELAYKTLKANPERLTPEIVLGLSQLITDHLARKQ